MLLQTATSKWIILTWCKVVARLNGDMIFDITTNLQVPWIYLWAKLGSSTSDFTLAQTESLFVLVR